jgi:hypothetical protein
MPKTGLFIALTLLLAPALAAAQTAPRQQQLEESLGLRFHWVGAETAALQASVYAQYNEAHTKPIVVPFTPQRTPSCHLTQAALIIHKDGAGEFDATTYAEAPDTGAVWRSNISIFDANNHLLFQTGDFDGPEMNRAGRAQPYVWVNRFTVDASTLRRLADLIDHGRLSFSC